MHVTTKKKNGNKKLKSYLISLTTMMKTLTALLVLIHSLLSSAIDIYFLPLDFSYTVKRQARLCYTLVIGTD